MAGNKRRNRRDPGANNSGPHSASGNPSSDSTSGATTSQCCDFHPSLKSTDDLFIESRKVPASLAPNKDGPIPIIEGKLGEESEIAVPMSARFTVNPTEFFDCMQQLAMAQIRDRQKRRYYFRGESSTSYTLLPTLLRDFVYHTLREKHNASSPIDLQKKLLDRYRRYTQHLIHSDNDFKAEISADFDTLCLAQHYGLPTLLMDWTLNAYVAAYFAVSGAYSARIRERLSAIPDLTEYCVRIWVMRLKPPEVRAQSTVHLEVRKKDWDGFLGDVSMAPAMPLVVVPLVFTRRIAAQAGRFIYCGHAASDNAARPDRLYSQSLAAYSYDQTKAGNAGVLSWDQLYSIDVRFEIENWRKSWDEDPANKDDSGNVKDPEHPDNARAKIDFKLKEFRRELSRMISGLEFTGFHAGRLFPDLEGWAKYLAEGNL